MGLLRELLRTQHQNFFFVFPLKTYQTTCWTTLNVTVAAVAQIALAQIVDAPVARNDSALPKLYEFIQAMYTSTLETRRNRIRNKKEWRYDDCDWLTVAEE